MSWTKCKKILTKRGVGLWFFLCWILLIINEAILLLVLIPLFCEWIILIGIREIEIWRILKYIVLLWYFILEIRSLMIYCRCLRLKLLNILVRFFFNIIFIFDHNLVFAHCNFFIFELNYKPSEIFFVYFLFYFSIFKWLMKLLFQQQKQIFKETFFILILLIF